MFKAVAHKFEYSKEFGLFSNFSSNTSGKRILIDNHRFAFKISFSASSSRAISYLKKSSRLVKSRIILTVDR